MLCGEDSSIDWLIISWNYKMVKKNNDVHSKGKNPKTTKDESKMVIHRKTGYFNFLKIKGDEMKKQKIVEKVDTKTKKEIANMWQKLDATQKAKYESKTPSTNASNKCCLKIGTRCSLKDIKDTINVLSDEKKAAIEEMGFVSLLEMKCGKLSHSMCRFLVDKLNPVESSIVLHGKTFKISVDDFVRIMGVKDGGEEVDFTGSMDDQHIVKVRNFFLGGKKLLKNNELKQIMVGTEEASDFFKVGFVMYALCTLQCPTTSVYVNLKYLLPLRDSKAIARKNWASYSLRFLLDSVRSFKENNQVYIGGCLLFLQLFYLDAIAHGSVLVDRSVLPLTVWGKVETEKMKKWLQKRGGFESDKVVVMKTEYGGLGDDAKTMTHFAEELSSIKKDVATLVATIARMDESLSKIMSELSSKNEEKERTLRTPCPHELEVKLNKEDDNMFNMGSDGGQKDLGNAKPPKSRPNKEDGTPNEQDDNVKGFATVDKTLTPSVEVIHERKHAKQPQNEV
ncbi:uncharacterized protein LOC117623771 isoform X1 [Prunus dulcis]|uniref:uncharacterized protein LOC117623771 isoform X1 n=3 Tax=Prunus dulcis TaxID=3755 RepID=UPI0014837411|nr:uncharacterized protein LOC117623771 isoform X1 [Prunus dulcis]